MDKVKKFTITTILGALLIVLPVAIVFMVYSWVYVKVTGSIQPITNFVVNQLSIPEFAADALVIVAIFASCFFLGLFVRNRFGRFVHKIVEDKILKKIPIYAVVRKVVIQFLGNKKSPFTSVGFAKLFDNDTLVTVLITDKCEVSGIWTVFMPTGPNPTSGNIYHLPAKCVFELDIPVEHAMRTILSCGAGSADLAEKYHKQYVLAVESLKSSNV